MEVAEINRSGSLQFNSGSNLIDSKGDRYICRKNWSSNQRIILSSPINISVGCGDREEICRLIGKKSRTYLLCCNNEIGRVDSLPLKEIAHTIDSDSDGEDEVNDLEMIEEMKVDEYIQMEADIEIDMEMEAERW